MRESFVLDSMLGRLAKWLRIMGYDAVYSPRFSDEELIDRAVKARAILLTRDKLLARLAKLRGVKVVMLPEDLAEQLVELAALGCIELRIDLSRTRCPICNTRLTRTKKGQIIDMVPRGVAERYDEFWLCPKCGKVYWPGSHLRSMVSFLEKLRVLKRQCNEGKIR